ncbi:acyltransferase [Paraburkholderia bryophila]|uniref:acyltransferase family protein n=1 Tax=Burkholderiaceae TaxID=119060 RepID=UPI00068DB027|nr:acyltransferase [Burkholderia sp. 9120]
MAVGSNQSGGGFPALTSIRFIAAFAVVISHFSERDLLPLPAALFNFIDGGRSAVSLFFVLSGFILTFTYRDKLAHGGVRSFYEARVARIYPMILLGLLMCVPVVIYLVLNDNPQLMLEWYALKGAIYPALLVSLIAQLLLLNGWLPFSAINQPWNGPSDSVSCEAFFYLLFPFLLRRMTTMSAARIGLIAVAMWLVTGAWIALLQNFVPLSRSAAMIYAMPVTRLAEFVMGIAVAIYYLRLRASGRSQHGKGIVLIGVALSAIFILSVWRPIWPAYYLESPFYAALILGLALLERPVLGLLSWRPLVRLGEASYSLYLTHLPLALWSVMLGFGPSNGWIMIPVSVLISLLCFRFYEEPMRRKIKTRFASQKTARLPAAESGQTAV